MTGSGPEALRRSDAEARALAQREFALPLVLEAGAGTGKTTTLVARVLAWSLDRGWERAAQALRAEAGEAPAGRIAARVLEGVVAITFTEAAAAEMSLRVAESLLAIERGEPVRGLLDDSLAPDGAERRRRARALRGALDRLAVQTIHAYCRRLLVGFPLEIGLHPRLEIDADQRLHADVVREVLEETLRHAYPNADHLALAARGRGPREIESELLRLLEEGITARALAADPLAPERIEALRDALGAALEAARRAADGRLHAARRAPAAVETAALVDETLERVRALRAEPGALEALVGWLRDAWADKRLARLQGWGNGRFAAAEREALAERAEAVPAAASALRARLLHALSLDPALLASAQRVFAPLLADVEARLRARGIAGFSALLRDAQSLLESPHVARDVRRRIDQLLVDEFQDTDARQCEIVRILALRGPLDERPGLFAVGDPKQSIYGWRNADLVAYDAFVDDVLAAGGTRAHLSVNYRSVPAILAEVERVIEPVMRAEKGVQPPFQPLVASEENAGREGFAAGWMATTEHWVTADLDPESGEKRETRSARAAALEAEALARDLRALHDEHGVAWKDVGVLFRSRGDWEIYLRALRAADVPFAVEGDRHYYKRREVVDAAALVACVLDPNDHVALVALLRSSAVGVPDAALLPLWTRGFPSHMSRLHGRDAESLAALREIVAQAAAELPAGIPGLARVAGWERSLGAALEALAWLRESRERDASDVLVERMRTALLFEAGEAARYVGVWRSANLERFFRDLTDELEAGGPHAALRRLRRALADEEREEEGRPVDLVDDAVRILTIHGAKGLDFAHVYVMQLHKGRGGIDEARVAGSGDDLAYRLFAGVDAIASLDWGDKQSAREAVEEAERARLLYVAMTRARERLVVAGLRCEFQNRTGRGRAVELLESRRDRPGDLPEMARRIAARGDGSFEDAGGTRWVFPALDRTRAPDRATRGRADVALPDAEAVAAASAALHAARAGADARMRRPFGTPASADPERESPEERAERGFGEAARGVRRSVARALGTAVHRALEELDLSAEPGPELERRWAALQEELRAALPAAAAREAAVEARKLLERLRTGALLERLRGLGDAVVARELPVLLPPGGDAAPDPVGYVSGCVDLVYRDPETGGFAIADYKTDAVRTDAEVAERVADYRRQGAAYQRAVREALRLDATPRFELWFLAADRREVVDPGGA